MKDLRCLGAVLLFAVGCTGEPAPATIDGATPEEAARTVAEVGCEKTAACGTISASCTPCPVAVSDCQVECTVEAQPYPVEACLEDSENDLARGFGCEELTSDEIALVNDCLAAAADEPCPSVEDVEAWVDGGREGRDPRRPIEACDIIYDDIIYRCEGGE
ncbi:MAG: hypothetical protein ACRBN8_43300 [Nannocystales bacterium]